MNNLDLKTSKTAGVACSVESGVDCSSNDSSVSSSASTSESLLESLSELDGCSKVKRLTKGGKVESPAKRLVRRCAGRRAESKALNSISMDV